MIIFIGKITLLKLVKAPKDYAVIAYLFNMFYCLQKIFSNLGSFANEGEVQGLIASFLKNLSHDSVTVRRTAGSCLHSIVSTSRRVSVTLLPLLDSILGSRK